MTWNYRIIRCNDVVSIHEVYYDDNGLPVSWTQNPAPVSVSVEESLVEVWRLMTKALLLPILEVDSDGSLKETQEILLSGNV